MAKSNTIQVKMVSTANTGYFYVKFRNPKTKTEKLELKKYFLQTVTKKSFES